MPSRRGPGRGRPSSANPDLLWVNRTPESDRLSASRQERDELRTITSHARQWRAALRRQQRLYTAQNEATHAQSIVGWGRQGNLSGNSSAEMSAAPSPVAITEIIGNSTDPFAYLETPEDGWWLHSAFQYAVLSWLPSVFEDIDVFDETLPSSESCLATIDRIVQGCLANRMHMFSLLAASTGLLKYVLGIQLDRRDSPEFCMGKALRYLRHHLASEPLANESLIFDLMALSTFERYVENFEGARTHFRMVQHLVQSLGGPEILEPPMRLICRLWDLLVAGGSGETPLLPLTWDPGPLTREQMQQEVFPDLASSGVIPSGTALLQCVAIVRSEFSPIVVDTVQWFQVQQQNHVHNFSPSPIELWSTVRSHALVHRMLSFFANPDNIQGMLTECIKQVFLLVISDLENARRSRTDSASTRDPTSFSWSNVSRLRHVLRVLVQNGEVWEDSHQEVVMWMACLGAQAAKSDDEKDWFMGLARHIVACRAEAFVQDDLTQLLGTYLHRCEWQGTPDVTGLERVFEH